MKKFYFSFVLIILSISFFACKQKDPQKVMYEQLKTTALASLEGVQVDSLKITHVDTVTAKGYAKIVLEMLENMQIDYRNAYKEAVYANDEAVMADTEFAIAEVDNVILQCMTYLQEDQEDQEKAMLYMVSAEFYQNGNRVPYLFFTTTAYDFYELDPFGNNLLD